MTPVAILAGLIALNWIAKNPEKIGYYAAVTYWKMGALIEHVRRHEDWSSRHRID